MKTNEQIKIVRDVRAVLIPSGDGITLKAGQDATITQSLGGSYTVVVLGNMARVDGKDADALGKDAAGIESDTPTAPINGPDLEAIIWDQLRTCFDPEIPVNIVDLGLVYDLDIAQLDDGQGHKVHVKMTLTAVGCGMGPAITADARQKVLGVPDVSEAEVELVWEPMWTQHMMSEAAKLQLGFL